MQHWVLALILLWPYLAAVILGVWMVMAKIAARAKIAVGDMRWNVYARRVDRPGQSVPRDDIRDHTLNYAENRKTGEVRSLCWCNPVDDDGVLVHNSADGREQFEPDYIGVDKRRVS